MLKRIERNEIKMKIHNLKIDKDVLLLKYARIKNWEIRYDDRGYKAGDILIEREYDRKTGRYGDNIAIEKIISLLPRYAEHGLRENFRILITQPLFYGSYEEVKSFLDYGYVCLDLINYVSKAISVEDYLVWDKLTKYDWKAIAHHVLFNAKLESLVKQ